MEGFIVRLDKIKVHQCDKCPRVFINNEGLRDHNARHDVQEQLSRARVMKHIMSVKVLLNRTQIYQCRECTRGFLLYVPLNEHQKEHSRETKSITQFPHESNNNYLKPHKCEECGLRFVERSTLTTHLKVHEPFHHVCHCGIGFYQAKDLATHGRLVHPTHQMKIESTETKIKSEFAVQPKKKRAKLRAKPRLLAKIVFSKPKVKSRSREMVLIPKNEDGDYECYLCGQAYTDKTTFFDHIKTHKGMWHHFCDKCPYRSPTLATLIAHTKSHDPSRNGQWQCDICKSNLKNQRSLAYHTMIHTGENYASKKRNDKENIMFCKNKDDNYECSLCGQIYKDKTTYFAHINSHTGQWHHVCDKCPFGSKTLATLIVHKKTHQADHNGIWKCDTCQAILKSKNGLIYHTLVHTGEKQFACTLCTKSFTQPGALKCHLKRHTDTRLFECDLCKRRFVDKGALSLHIRTHTGLKPYSCKDCGKQFSDPSAFNRHRRIHTGEKPYRCKYCPKAFSDISAHIVHTRRHEGVTYTCEICRKQLCNHSGLYNHMKSVHENNVFECDYCGMKTNHKHNLMMHIKTVHFKVKRYKCSYCQKQFYHRHNHKSHIQLVHETGNVCPICDRLFKTEGELVKHKCVKCTICDKHFKSNLDMKTHLKRHSNRKELRCPECPKKFFDITALNKHRSECHGIVACDHCGEKYDGKRKLTNHIWSKHMLSLYCDVCMRRFYTESAFRNHKMRKACERRVACKICKFKFRQSIIVRHLMISHLNMRLKCVTCGMKFRCKERLIQHFRSAHGAGK